MLGQALAIFPMATQSLDSTPQGNNQTWVTQCPDTTVWTKQAAKIADILTC